MTSVCQDISTHRSATASSSRPLHRAIHGFKASRKIVVISCAEEGYAGLLWTDAHRVDCSREAISIGLNTLSSN